MSEVNKTTLYERHLSLGAKMVDFAGWQMPLHYKTGTVQEHLATRKHAGLFDISHMGRFAFSGERAVPFLQHVLSNNAAALDVEESQYTIIPNSSGGAIDDAYLYRFYEDEYLLVVNAANRQKDWNHFQQIRKDFKQLDIIDRSDELVMLSLQGPLSRKFLTGVVDSGLLPEPIRNQLSTVTINGVGVLVGRTGYTGEPLCFELFINSKDALMIWDLLIDAGATPIGLGARDTLRLEAAMPLFGCELGLDAEGNEIPVFAEPLAKYAVSFSGLKGDFVGKNALSRQFKALEKITDRDYSLIKDLPRRIMPVALMGKGIARPGNKVFVGDKLAGYITSGTMIPYWETEGEGLSTRFLDEHAMRAIGLALLDSDLCEADTVEIEVRGRKIPAVIVPYHLRSEAPPCARAILEQDLFKDISAPTAEKVTTKKVRRLLDKAIQNHTWRQRECINLIPSEQTPSAMTRMLSVLDPVGRYAEHKPMKAFLEMEVFFYQGTDFILEVEELLKDELLRYLGCCEVETRLISGQMANTAVFSALVDYLNRADRKAEQRRIRRVMNNHIIKGGHLSAQPMGALRDFVARDPKTEKPAVVNFPVVGDNPYKIDTAATQDVLARYRPELIILGKSVTLHPEPVAQLRSFVRQLDLNSVIMYDMAHVLGLLGSYFQQPFEEGADIVTGSTHKTFFGTQRGIVAANYSREDLRYQLWEAVNRRAFPGSVSNHHLGTLLGLLMAAYEMNYFKDEYQKNVIDNAKAFAMALHDCGLDVAGDKEVSFTETHQVIVNVGYSKGPEIARRLEENNIIVNYQAAPQEEGFTASGALRMGVAEMTRFAMKKEDFKTLAQLIYDVIAERTVKEKVMSLRGRFVDMKYCFTKKDFAHIIEKLHKLI